MIWNLHAICLCLFCFFIGWSSPFPVAIGIRFSASRSGQNNKDCLKKVFSIFSFIWIRLVKLDWVFSSSQSAPFGTVQNFLAYFSVFRSPNQLISLSLSLFYVCSLNHTKTTTAPKQLHCLLFVYGDIFNTLTVVFTLFAIAFLFPSAWITSHYDESTGPNNYPVLNQNRLRKHVWLVVFCLFFLG